jgi:hypothetical protein
MTVRSASTRTNSASAVLVVTATVMPVVMAPPPTSENGNTRDVLINLPSRQLEMDVTSEWHTFSDRSGTALKTTTVVSR